MCGCLLRRSDVGHGRQDRTSNGSACRTPADRVTRTRDTTIAGIRGRLRRRTLFASQDADSTIADLRAFVFTLDTP